MDLPLFSLPQTRSRLCGNAAYMWLLILTPSFQFAQPIDKPAAWMLVPYISPLSFNLTYYIMVLQIQHSRGKINTKAINPIYQKICLVCSQAFTWRKGKKLDNIKCCSEKMQPKKTKQRYKPHLSRTNSSASTIYFTRKAGLFGGRNSLFYKYHFHKPNWPFTGLICAHTKTAASVEL